jgi:hypothetical protein
MVKPKGLELAREQDLFVLIEHAAIVARVPANLDTANNRRQANE